MAKFRNGPQIVEAVQWDGKNLLSVLGLVALGSSVQAMSDGSLRVFTPQYNMICQIGDWFVLDGNGYQNVISDGMFRATTEPID